MQNRRCWDWSRSMHRPDLLTNTPKVTDNLDDTKQNEQYLNSCFVLQWSHSWKHQCSSICHFFKSRGRGSKRYIHLKPVLKALNDWDEKATTPCKHGLCTVWKKCLQASASINVFWTQRKFGPIKVLWPVQWTRWVLSSWHVLWIFWRYTSVAVVTQPECMTVCAMLCTVLEQGLTDSSQTKAL